MLILAGSFIGTVSDVLLYALGFQILLNLKLIELSDPFDGIYTHLGLQQTLCWGVYFMLILLFGFLRKRFPTSQFAIYAFVLHIFVGGLCSVVISALNLAFS